MPRQDASMNAHDRRPFQRRRLHAIGESDPGPEGIARRLCKRWRRRAAGDPHHPRSGRLHRRDQRLPGDRQRRRPALHPAPRWTDRFSAVLDDQRSASPTSAATASSSPRQPCREPAAYLFLIDYAHRRRIKIWGRRASSRTTRALRQAHARGLQGTTGAGDALQGGRLGLDLPATYPPALRSGRRRGGACRARQAHLRVGSRGRAAQVWPLLTLIRLSFPARLIWRPGSAGRRPASARRRRP